MSSEVVEQSLFRDATTNDPVKLATTRSGGVDKLQVDATGIGPVTLDPTNLALDATVTALQSATQPVTLGTAQKVSYTASAGLSSAFGATQIIICSTTDCHILIGSAPTATANDFFLPAKTLLRLTVNSAHKLSAIRDASDGNIFISPAV